MDMKSKDPFCQFGQLCHHRRQKFKLPKQEGSLKKLRSFPVDGYSRRMCVFAGALWLPCCFDNCILVYSFDGLLIQVVKNFTVEKPFSLCPYNDSCLLLAAGNGIFMMQNPPREKSVLFDTANSGQMTTLLRSGSFCDIHLEYPNMASIEYKRGQLHLTTYRQAHGRQTETTDKFKLHFENDYLDTVFLKRPHVYVTSCTQHSVFKYTCKGVCLESFGSPGEGPSKTPNVLMFPSLCNAVVEQGCLLIADALNDVIKSVSDEGEWRVLSDNGVKHPVDAVLADDNTLLVLSGKLNDYKVHKFEIISEIKDSGFESEQFEDVAW